MNKSFSVLSRIGNQIGKPPGWERIVRMFAPPEKCADLGELCIVRDGVVFVAKPATFIGWSVAFFGTYEPELREIFRAVLLTGGVAVDVGANVGWHTLLMARLVGDEGRVLAAEANPSVRGRLHNNLKLNRFTQVEVIPFAIADTEGIVDFYDPEADNSDPGNGHVVADGAPPKRETIRVETRRLDTIVSMANVERLDLIKIDVEGFEWPVLKGGEQSIAKFRPHIIFEYNAEYTSRGRADPCVIAEFFHRQRYRLFAIRRNWAESVGPENWPDNAEIWATPLG